MEIVSVLDVTRGTEVAARVELANSLVTRGRGLLGRKELPAGCGLLIVPCNSVHSFFMQFRFDALFLDREYRVLHIIAAMKPWRVSRIVRGAHAVLELPAGTARAAGVEAGDQLAVQR